MPCVPHHGHGLELVQGRQWPELRSTREFDREGNSAANRQQPERTLTPPGIRRSDPLLGTEVYASVFIPCCLDLAAQPHALFTAHLLVFTREWHQFSV